MLIAQVKDSQLGLLMTEDRIVWPPPNPLVDFPLGWQLVRIALSLAHRTSTSAWRATEMADQFGSALALRPTPGYSGSFCGLGLAGMFAEVFHNFSVHFFDFGQIGAGHQLELCWRHVC